MMYTAYTNRHILSGGRYPVMRALGILSVIGAAVAVVAGVCGFVWALVRSTLGWGNQISLFSGRFSIIGDRLSLGLEILAAAFFVCLGLLLVAEVIKFIMDIEHGVRSCALSLSLRAEPQPTAVTPTPAGPVAVPTSPMVANRIAAFYSADEETAEAALVRGH